MVARRIKEGTRWENTSSGNKPASDRVSAWRIENNEEAWVAKLLKWLDADVDMLHVKTNHLVGMSLLGI